MTDVQTQPQAQAPMEGVSNPPNGGQVLDISNPEANDSTIPQAQAANQPLPAGSPQATPPGANGAPVQGNTANGPVPGQAQKPGQQPDLSKGPNLQQAAAIAQNSQVQQQVKKAGAFHAMAEALAGGPRYTYTMDEFGQMQKQKVPISNGHLALAIAMEALSGAAAGFGVANGPGNLGRAAAAGFQKGEQQRVQQDQQARQQATEDYTRKVQSFETNLRMYGMARQYGKMDLDINKEYDAQYAPVLQFLQQKAPGFIEGPISYDQLSKYNITSNNAIPAMTVPRNDPKTGKQVEINGVPQWDHLYYVVKPGAKLSGLFSQDDLDTAKKYGYSWGDNTKLLDSPFELTNYLNIKSQLAELNTTDKMLNHEFDKIDNQEQPTTYKIGKEPAPINKYDNIAQSAAAKYAETAKVSTDDLTNYVRALISQESGGNPNAKSPTGVKGIMQVALRTAQQYGLSDEDRTNPEKGIDAGTHYFADLLAKYKNPTLAMAAYYSGPGAIKDGNIVSTAEHTADDTNKYVQQVSDKLGLEANKIKTAPKKSERLSMPDWISKYPQSKSAFTKFMTTVNALPQGSEGMWGVALDHMAKEDPQGTASVVSFLNQSDPDTIRKHDEDIQTENEQRKQEQANKADIQKKTQELDLKQQQNMANADRMSTVIKGPEGFQFDPKISDMDAGDAADALKQQGVTVPENFEDLYAIAKYDQPPSDYTPKVWRTGDPNVMSKAQAISYIRRFLNPDYKEGDYKGTEAARIELRKENSPVGKMLSAAGTALYHMQILKEAAAAVGNDRIKFLNRLANELGVQTGDDEVAVYRAILPKLSDEVSKAAMAGNTPYQGQIEEGRESLASDFSQGQVNRVLDGYMNLIHGRMVNQEGITRKTAKEHLPVPDELSTEFKRLGYTTPWNDGLTDPISASSKVQQPQVPQGYKAMTRDGKMVQTMAGDWIPNPNQAQQSPQQPNRAEQFVQSQR